MQPPPHDTYPGTTVLVNRLDLRDQAALTAAESRLTALRRSTLRLTPAQLEQPAGLAEAHRHLFQDVYPWAGEHRRVQLAKAQRFLPAELVPGALRDAFAGLREALPPRDLDAIRSVAGSDPGLAAAAFAERVSRTVASLNYTHPFREGNGRAVRGFVDQLTRTAGLELDERKLDRSEWIRASIESTQSIRNLDRLEGQLRVALVPVQRSREVQRETRIHTRPARGREDLER